MAKLLHCNHCGKLFKIVNEQTISAYTTHLITDFGDTMQLFTQVGDIECINCGNYSKFDLINCPDWVADKIFTVKGC